MAAKEKLRKHGVDDEAHLGDVNYRVVELSSCVLESRHDVALLQIRVVRQDLLMGCARGKQVEHVGHSNPERTQARSTPTLLRVDRDAV